MENYKSISWTGRTGRKLELRARCETTMVAHPIDLDGDILPGTPEPVEDAMLEFWADGKKMDICRDTNFWRFIDIPDGLKKIWGLCCAVVPEQAERIDAFLKDVIAQGTSEDVKTYRAEQEAEKATKSIAHAEAVIAAAEKTQKNPEGSLMTRAEARDWKRRYNNLHNEGGEGYIPNVITVEDVAEANKILGK